MRNALIPICNMPLLLFVFDASNVPCQNIKCCIFILPFIIAILLHEENIKQIEIM